MADPNREDVDSELSLAAKVGDHSRSCGKTTPLGVSGAVDCKFQLLAVSGSCS